jgi:hypothetical protein
MYESLGAEIGYRYHDSPIVWPDDAPEPPCEEVRYRPTTWSGARLPSGFRDDGQAVFDQLDARGFTLLAMGVSDGDTAPMERAARDLRIPLTVLPIREPHLAELYERTFVLVRPDQHVCWRGDSLPSSPAQVLDQVRGGGA